MKTSGRGDLEGEQHLECKINFFFFKKVNLQDASLLCLTPFEQLTHSLFQKLNLKTMSYNSLIKQTCSV